MPSYLFLALLLPFLLLFCTLCGVASADPVNQSVELFKEGPTYALEPNGGGGEQLVVDYAWSPSLVGAGSVVVGLTHIVRPNGKHDILTKYIETQEDNWWDRAIEKDDGKNWKPQLAWKSEKTRHIAFGSVAKGDSVYVLSASEAFSASSFLQKTANATAWDFQLSIGTITNGTNATVKMIKWDTRDVSDSFLSEDIQENLQGLIPYEGSAFLTEDGTFVFVLRAWSIYEGKYVFVVAHSKDPSKSFTSHFVGTTADCRFSFFSWGEKLFMVPRRCLSGSDSDYKVKESNDTGKTWGDVTGSFGRRLNNLTRGRDSFTRITIEERRVLLFTVERLESVASSGKKYITLFMADDYHVVEMGSILTDASALVHGSLAYANDELFFLCVQKGGIKNTILMRLKAQLEKIKLLLKTRYLENS